MAASPDTTAWNAAPLTKFRAPRIRRDVVMRPVLLERLKSAVDSYPLTLVCAPGGFGKTTLLAQLAAGTEPGNVLLWATVDEDDNERQRFFATLLRMLESLQLAWETPPAALLAHAARSDSQCRTALAALVNALCTVSVQRIVLVLDDLHKIDQPGVFELLESLIERLPDHVAIVLGSRVEPALPLARWRAHGEFAEIVPWDLQFTEAEAAALASVRLGVGLDTEALREIVRRTHGWAAGLTLALQSHMRSGPQLDGGATRDQSDRHLFAYLAQEVLAELPAELCEFVLRCSVLTELSPDACEIVTGRSDSRLVLEALYRRNLFLTATDDSIPVLRFHDLFREFLQNELERRSPELVADLHERAGRAEQSLPRSITHFLKAERWTEAMRLIATNGEAMLAAGDHASIERWIDQIPQAARGADPYMSYLRGICAWLRWDWPRARNELQPAVAGFASPQETRVRIRAMFLLVDAYSSVGDGAKAWQLMGQIELLPLDELAKAQLALQRAWYVLLEGPPERVGEYLAEFIAHAEREPAVICPQTADRIHCLCIGLPRVADSFERFFALSELVRGSTDAPWQLAALPVGAWANLWRGRREPIAPILARGDALHQKFGGIRLVSERLLQFRAVYYVATGQYEAAATMISTLIDTLLVPEAIAHRAVWLRGYQHALARCYWIANDIDKFRALAPTLLAPRVATEWPFIDAAIELVRGQLALLRQDWPTAQAALEQSVRLHARFPLPMSYSDPRISLAYLHLQRADKPASWRAFEPVYTEVIEQQAIGPLLLEPIRVRDAILDAAPREIQASAAYESLRTKLALWSKSTTEQPVPAGPLVALSEREHEVLSQVAAGASNKHIARDLALSLHTVKRHIANILDKLDCGSRGQAAEVYRRAKPG